jgi:hypothetical protein
VLNRYAGRAGGAVLGLLFGLIFFAAVGPMIAVFGMQLGIFLTVSIFVGLVLLGGCGYAVVKFKLT